MIEFHRGLCVCCYCESRWEVRGCMALLDCLRTPTSASYHQLVSKL